MDRSPDGVDEAPRVGLGHAGLAPDEQYGLLGTAGDLEVVDAGGQVGAATRGRRVRGPRGVRKECRGPGRAPYEKDETGGDRTEEQEEKQTEDEQFRWP